MGKFDKLDEISREGILPANLDDRAVGREHKAEQTMPGKYPEMDLSKPLPPHLRDNDPYDINK